MIVSTKINIKKYKEEEFYRKINAKLRGEKYIPRPIIDFKFFYIYKK